MDKIDETIKSVKERIATFMANKPMWAFWILYTVLSGVVFTALYGVVRVLAQRWWAAAITIVVIGLVWGTSTFSNMRSTQPPEEKT